MFEYPGITDNLYYCGWNRSTSVPSVSVLISHPSEGSHLMKISKSNNVSDAGLWWRSIWYVGGASSGSSGGPLFDANKRIIGTHSGRYLTPNMTSDEVCRADGRAGKLSATWNTNGTGGYKISKWLDPDNSGATTMDGGYYYDCPSITLNGQQTTKTVICRNIIVNNVVIPSGVKLELIAIDKITISDLTINTGGTLELDCSGSVKIDYGTFKIMEGATFIIK